MKSAAYDSARRGQLKSRAAWQTTIEATKPRVMITLGTNREMSEENLLRKISRALVELDSQRRGNPRRLGRHSASSRVTAFIMPERLRTNAHAHLLVYSALQVRNPDCAMTNKIAQTRYRDDFVGHREKSFVPKASKNDPEPLSRLAKIWLRLVPGGHYYARTTDKTVGRAIDYTMKELAYNFDRNVHLSQEFWPSDQLNMERTLPIDRDLRPSLTVV
jgi:hypothetical protein